MEKRGSGHLEMILAFTIFFLAVVFLLVYIRPLETNKLTDIAVISLKNSFIEDTQTQLISVFVNSTGERCAPNNTLELSSTYRNIITTKGVMYYALFSSEIVGKMEDCSSEPAIGSWATIDAISNKSIVEMQEKYYSDYAGLKEDLKMPMALDFEIYSTDGVYEMKKGGSGEIDIIAKRYTLSVLGNDGELINREFVFRVW